jgi:hypothetical protein
MSSSPVEMLHLLSSHSFSASFVFFPCVVFHRSLVYFIAFCPIIGGAARVLDPREMGVAHLPRRAELNWTRLNCSYLGSFEWRGGDQSPGLSRGGTGRTGEQTDNGVVAQRRLPAVRATEIRDDDDRAHWPSSETATAAAGVR